jgi:hypothetical protein
MRPHRCGKAQIIGILAVLAIILSLGYERLLVFPQTALILYKAYGLNTEHWANGISLLSKCIVGGACQDRYAKVYMDKTETEQYMGYLSTGVERNAPGPEDNTPKRRHVYAAGPVSAGIIGNATGYIRVTSMAGYGTYGEFKKAKRIIDSEGVSGMVIDLRNTRGGHVANAADICGIFVRNDTTVATLYYYKGGMAEIKTTNDGKTEYPVIVLVDKNTRSAAEMLAGALGEEPDITTIGERTYGKGEAYGMFMLPDGGSILLPIAYFTTRSGERITGTGVNPEVELTWGTPDDEENIDDAVKQYIYDRQNGTWTGTIKGRG